VGAVLVVLGIAISQDRLNALTRRTSKLRPGNRYPPAAAKQSLSTRSLPELSLPKPPGNSLRSCRAQTWSLQSRANQGATSFGRSSSYSTAAASTTP
jgi:hypothetical protein